MAWVLHMQQLKTKVVEFTQTRPTLFKDGLLGNNYQYWFKNQHLELNIERLVKGLEICRAQDLTSQSYSYQSLQTFYIKHKCKYNYIWNINEKWIQIGQQSQARVLARRGSHQIYNTIPRSKEWLTINYVVNAAKGSFPRFYIFKGKRIRHDYIKHSKSRTIMVMQTKTWMTTFQGASFHQINIYWF